MPIPRSRAGCRSNRLQRRRQPRALRPSPIRTRRHRDLRRPATRARRRSRNRQRRPSPATRRPRPAPLPILKRLQAIRPYHHPFQGRPRSALQGGTPGDEIKEQQLDQAHVRRSLHCRRSARPRPQRRKLDQGHDRSPVTCTTGTGGRCKAQVPADERESYGLPVLPARSRPAETSPRLSPMAIALEFFRPQRPRQPKTTAWLLARAEITGVVIQKSSAKLTSAQLAALDGCAARRPGRDSRLQDRRQDLHARRLRGPRTPSLPRRRRNSPIRFGQDVQIDWCDEKAPGPPLGMTPVSFSALNSELPQATLGICVKLRTPRGAQRDDQRWLRRFSLAGVLTGPALAQATGAELRAGAARQSLFRQQGIVGPDLSRSVGAAAHRLRRLAAIGVAAGQAAMRSPSSSRSSTPGSTGITSNIDSDKLWRNPKEIPDNGIDDDKNGYVDDVIGWDFLKGDAKPWDHDGHGTFVAGIIAGDWNDKTGIAGINPFARLMILKGAQQFRPHPLLLHRRGDRLRRRPWRARHQSLASAARRSARSSRPRSTTPTARAR